MDDREGQQIGQYRLIRRIGQGGFGTVYIGEDTTNKSEVAIKVLPSDLSREELDKFLAQVRVASAFNHPHIIRILAFGEENGTPYLVMDYAPYGSLRELHPRGTQLPLSTIVSYLKQIADALQYIHDQNMIHRDIKPHNMLLGPNHEILLSDFGIAVASESMGYRRQKVQEFEGTILYAAPEQIRGRSRFASDQYALGVLVYEWLSGSCPFYGTVEEVASQHTLVPPPPLREKLPTISPAIEQVVLKALAKDVDKRFESVQAFAIALERASRLDLASKRQATPNPLISSSPLPLTIPSPQEREATTQEVLLTYREHTDKIHLLAWSPDGSSIASSSLDETIKLWDATTGETLLTYRGNSLEAFVFAWSPDGRYIASTSGLSSENVQVWETASGHSSLQHTTFTAHSEQIYALSWSPDGNYIASASEDATVQVWEALTGHSVFTYRGHTLGVQTVAWSPDGKRIATGSADKTIQVWDATTGGNILVYYAHHDKINAVTWSPGGTHIASASDDTTMQVWDSSTGRKAFIYANHSGGVTAVTWSPNGLYIASASLDETVQVLHAITGRMLYTYTGHCDWVSTVAWSPNSQDIASGSWDKTVQVWKVK